MKNFITIEGCDGVGKTYQVGLLKQYCQQHGDNNILFTREPGGSATAEKIRNIILDANNSDISDWCEAFLYCASRVQHLDTVVIPALAEGKTVICDRFVHSSYAYQGVGRNIGLDRIIALNELAVRQYMPEFTIFLELTPEEAFIRKGGVDKSDRLENVNEQFHQAVYNGYHQVIDMDRDKFIVIDASGSAEQTHQLIVDALRAKGVL